MSDAQSLMTDCLEQWSPYAALLSPPNVHTPRFQCFSAAQTIGAPPGFPIDWTATSGWSLGHWKSKHFVVGFNPGDKIVFNLDLTGTSVTVYAWAGHDIGLGDAKLYFEDEPDKAQIMRGQHGVNHPSRAHMITSNSQGAKRLVVEIIAETSDPHGQHEFRVAYLLA